MKTHFIIVFILLFSTSIYAQEQEPSKKLTGFPKKTLISAAFFPSFYLNTETLLINNITMKNEIGVPWNIYKESENILFNYQVIYRGSLNWYYNFKRRLAKEKNIQGFAGNYLSLFSQVGIFNPYWLKYNFPWQYYAKYAFGIGLTYGIQRTFGKTQRGFYDISAGIIYTPYRRVKFAPEIKARIGFRLTKTYE